LRAKQKTSAEFLIALVFACAAVRFLGRGTVIGVPFTHLACDLGVLYYPLLALVVVSATNAVNLTDGLDGLAAGCAAISAVGYILISILAVKTGFLQGLAVNSSDLTIFAAAIAGGCVGFLRFNFIRQGCLWGLRLARFWGSFGRLAILSRTEIVLIILGGVYVLEALSVLVQVISFQTRGKRIFRMAPLHHHFELGGWSELRVVAAFWTAALIFTFFGVMSFAAMVG
jgi:phospho-N-acetylmuramoyl-pentapeptide-transferase